MLPGSLSSVDSVRRIYHYVKDDWQIRPALTLGFGLRCDWQHYFHDANNVAPRFSLA